MKSQTANVRATLKLYTPHAGQLPLHQSTARFNAVNFGRQSGKTTFGLNKIFSRAWRGPHDGVYWYILQTHRAAYSAFKRLLKFYHRCPGAFLQKPNESTKTAILRHGPSIEFLSGGNFDDLRMETLSGVVIDEYRQQAKELWAVIRPMLAKRRSESPLLGWADFLSTPNGFDHWKDLCDEARVEIAKAQLEGRVPEWAYFSSPSTCAPWWTSAEVESARLGMSADMFAQEIMAEFRNLLTGMAFGSYSSGNEKMETPLCPEEMRDGTGLLSRHHPVVICLDFNVSPMAWPMLQHATNKFYCFDMIWLERTVRGTAEAAEALVARLKFYGIKQVTIIGDAAGKQQRTSAVGQTDYTILFEILEREGIAFENRTPEANPLIKDRVNTTNARLCSAVGLRALHIHPVNCKELKRDFERVTWADLMTKPKDPMRGHAVSALGYALNILAPLDLSGEDDFAVKLVRGGAGRIED